MKNISAKGACCSSCSPSSSKTATTRIVDRHSLIGKIRLSLFFGLGVLFSELPVFSAADGFVSRGGFVSLYCGILYLAAGRGVLFRALKGLARGEIFNENMLMSVATIGAFALGAPLEAVGVMVFYRWGEFFEDTAVTGTRRSLEALSALRPDKARKVLASGKTQMMSPEAVSPGDIIRVLPGERIPLDGDIEEGSSAVDTASLTGESLPMEISPGQEVFAGTVNLTSALMIRVTHPYEKSAIARIKEVVEEALHRKAPAEKFISRFARWYTPLVFLAALLVALIPPFLNGGGWSVWLYRSFVILVISCPCALVISVPLAFFSGIGRCASRGILVKGSAYLNRMADLKSLYWDKTGTLTEGRFHVEAVLPAEGKRDEELLLWAASIESDSVHPLAAAVRGACDSPLLTPGAHDGRCEMAGRGIKGTLQGKAFFLGKPSFIREECGFPPPDSFPALSGELPVGSRMDLVLEGEWQGALILQDTLKAGAAEALQQLSDEGVERQVLLSGDTPAEVERVVSLLALDEGRGGLLPEEKQHYLAVDRRSCAGFVGDGINDSPVLAEADLGIALGHSAADAAVETADVVIMRGEPGAIAEVLSIARHTRRLVYQNISGSLLVKLGVLLLGAFGVVSMALAVFADVGVTVLAILNVLRPPRRGKGSVPSLKQEGRRNSPSAKTFEP